MEPGRRGERLEVAQRAAGSRRYQRDQPVDHGARHWIGADIGMKPKPKIKPARAISVVVKNDSFKTAMIAGVRKQPDRIRFGEEIAQR
jgi:hypothetical protein